MNNEKNTQSAPSEQRQSGTSARSLKLGGYSLIMTAVVIGAAILINLIVNRLPTKFTKLDNSQVGLYSISEQSEEIARSISEDVTIYMIAEQGSEDTTIEELVGRYTGLNSKIKFRLIDPALYPSFVSNYTSAQLSGSSLIVESEKRAQIIDYNDIFVTEYSINEQTGQVQSNSSFAGEARVTSALQYVTTDDIPRVYVLNGHGEQEIPETMKNYLRDDNFDLRDLSLLTVDAVPADADCVMIFAPEYDINADEAEMLINYLKTGGSVVVITGFGDSTVFANLSSVGEYYGITPDWGLVVEGSSDHYYTYPYFLLPHIGTHAITESMETAVRYVMLPYAMGLKKAETAPRATVKLTDLLYTSNSAYSKHGEIESVEKADGDGAGPFTIAMAAEEGNAKLVWFTSPYIIDEQIDQYVAGGNSSYFLSTMGWIGGKSDSISIATKKMQVQALTLTESEANIWTVVLIGVVPLVTIVIGGSIWYKRRKS